MQIPAVLFLVYKRPEETRKVLNRILESGTKKIYVSHDGFLPENRMNWIKVKEILDSIPRNVELIRWEQECHLGCKKAVSEAISRFFELESEGIILEDDTLPHPDFFKYASVLLHRYRSDDSIALVSGTNNNGYIEDGASYGSILTSNVWGWASWRRAWKRYDIEMRYWPELGDSDYFKLAHQSLAKHKQTQYQRTFEGSINTWDYQWEGSIMANRMKCIIPNRNLVENIGYGPEATHTFETIPYLYNKVGEGMEFPLVHPLSLSK